MIFLKLEIDNFYMFKNTCIDFTYSKKVTNSTIEHEFLEEFPNIKYKKVCIFMGSNASGKTSLGKVMCAINNYLAGRSLDDSPLVAMCDKSKNSSFEVVYVTPETKEIHKLKVIANKNGLLYESHKVAMLRKSKSLKDTLKDLDNTDPETEYDRDDNAEIQNPGFQSVSHLTGKSLLSDLAESHSWGYTFADFETSSPLFNYTVETELIKTILTSFDTSIDTVEKIEESDKNSHIVKFSNGDEVFITNDGKTSNCSRFSRGTLEAIEVSSFLHFLMEKGKSTSASLFLDEKMAYSHSEVELSMLNLMIDKIGKTSQFFYTTHNCDVLDMNLPTHSYIFLKKDSFVEAIHPEKLGYTKNDRSLLGSVKNDVFDTSPDLRKIEEFV